MEVKTMLMTVIAVSALIAILSFSVKLMIDPLKKDIATLDKKIDKIDIKLDQLILNSQTRASVK